MSANDKGINTRPMNSVLPIKLSEMHTILSNGMIFLPGKSNFPKYVLQERKSTYLNFLHCVVPENIHTPPTVGFLA